MGNALSGESAETNQPAAAEPEKTNAASQSKPAAPKSPLKTAQEARSVASNHQINRIITGRSVRGQAGADSRRRQQAAGGVGGEQHPRAAARADQRRRAGALQAVPGHAHLLPGRISDRVTKSERIESLVLLLQAEDKLVALQRDALGTDVWVLYKQTPDEGAFLMLAFHVHRKNGHMNNNKSIIQDLSQVIKNSTNAFN